MTSLDGINGRSIQTLLRGENDSKQSDEFQARLQYDFPENFRCNLPLNESENFSDSSLHDIFESESFRFPFSAKNSLTWGVK